MGYHQKGQDFLHDGTQVWGCGMSNTGEKELPLVSSQCSAETKESDTAFQLMAASIGELLLLEGAAA